MTIPHYNAMEHAQDVYHHLRIALGLAGEDDIAAEGHTDTAIACFHRLADDLGFVALAKADHVAMTAYIEEVRDFRPTIFRDNSPDPQDREDDLMPVCEFQAFQVDAVDLVGTKVKVAA